MTKKTITVNISPDARELAVFVQTAGRFSSNIYIYSGEKKINAKSIMGTLSLGIDKGQQLDIVADGSDEAKAVEELAMALE